MLNKKRNETRIESTAFCCSENDQYVLNDKCSITIWAVVTPDYLQENHLFRPWVVYPGPVKAEYIQLKIVK